MKYQGTLVDSQQLKKSLFLLALVSCLETTENPHHTVTYNPCSTGLPYDGIVIPDCSKYQDYPLKHEQRLFQHLSCLRLAGSWSVALQEKPVCTSVQFVRQRWTATPSVMDSAKV